MLPIFNNLRDINSLTILFRMVLAVVCGAVIGIERSIKNRPAGFRTHILIIVGATTASLTGHYVYLVMGLPTDMSRLGAQVITGLGFIGAGTIIVTGAKTVKGLTTAAGLFCSACMGFACGAGMYDCVLIVLVILVVVLDVMFPLEGAFKRRLRNMTIYVEFADITDLDEVLAAITGERATVYDIDVERTKASGGKYPAAVIVLQMDRSNASHSGMLSTIAELPCVHTIHELIA